MERHEVIQIRVSPREKERYTNAAKKMMLTVSEWMRKICDKETK